jgi:hypothetical protein
MSESGQTRRFDPQPATSGPPQSTDIARPARLVPFVPDSDARFGQRRFLPGDRLTARSPAIA